MLYPYKDLNSDEFICVYDDEDNSLERVSLEAFLSYVSETDNYQYVNGHNTLVYGVNKSITISHERLDYNYNRLFGLIDVQWSYNCLMVSDWIHIFDCFSVIPKEIVCDKSIIYLRFKLLNLSGRYLYIPIGEFKNNEYIGFTGGIYDKRICSSDTNLFDRNLKVKHSILHRVDIEDKSDIRLCVEFAKSYDISMLNKNLKRAIALGM